MTDKDLRDNALYASHLYWEADKAEKRAEKKLEELHDFVGSHKLDMKKYMELTTKEK